MRETVRETVAVREEMREVKKVQEADSAETVRGAAGTEAAVKAEGAPVLAPVLPGVLI